MPTPPIPRIEHVSPDPGRPPLTVVIGRNDDGSYNARLEAGGIPRVDAVRSLLMFASVLLREGSCPRAHVIASHLDTDVQNELITHACLTGEVIS